MKVRPFLLVAVTTAGVLALSAVAQPPAPVEPIPDDDPATVALAAAQSLDPDALLDVIDKLDDPGRAPADPKTAVLLKAQADKMRSLALRAAVAKRDVKAIDRIEADATKSKNAALANEAKLAKKLVSGSRAAGGVAVSIDLLTPEAVDAYHTFARNVEAAKITGDADRLANLTEVLPTLPDLPDPVRAALKKKVDEAKADLPPADETVELLKKLSAGGRGAQGTGTLAVETQPDGKTISLPPNTFVNLPVGATIDSPATVGAINVTTSGVSVKTAPTPAKRWTSGTPNAFVLVCPGLPLALVVDGKRIQFGTAIAYEFATRIKCVNSAGYHAYPGLAEIHKGCPVYGAPGRPACFFAKNQNVKVAVDSAGPIGRNGSSISNLSLAAYDKIKNVATLRVNY